MALLPIQNTFKKPLKGLPTYGVSKNQGLTPFEVYLPYISGGVAYAAISAYSSLFKNFNATSSLPISGLNFAFPFTYPNKIYLEIIYDSELSPVYGKIKVNRKWPTSVVNTLGGENTQTYPNFYEIITSGDIAQKTTELEADNTNNEAIRTSSLATITQLAALGYYTPEEVTSLNAKINNTYDECAELLEAYLEDFPNFFSSGGTRKLFKTINLIAYTTKDFSNNLKGLIFNPETVLNPNNIAEGAEPTIVAEEKKFKVVQCCNADLMIVPTNYGNTAGKVAIQWGRGVYDFFQDDVLEETTNTR
jgi:hypothetical protein